MYRISLNTYSSQYPFAANPNVEFNIKIMLISRINLIILDQPVDKKKKDISKQICCSLPCTLALCEFEFRKVISGNWMIIIFFSKYTYERNRMSCLIVDCTFLHLSFSNSPSFVEKTKNTIFIKNIYWIEKIHNYY